MKKILPLCLCVLFVLPCLLIPAMAAETGGDTFYVDNSIEDNPCILIGEDEETITFYYLSPVVLPENMSGALFQTYSNGEFLDEDTLEAFSGAFIGTVFCSVPSAGFNLYGNVFPYPGIWVLGPSEVGVESYSIVFPGYDLFPSEAPSSGPISNVTIALSSVLTWMKSVTTSLLSGELNPLLPLLAIPVAISIVLFAIKAVKTIAWGS